MKTLVQIAALGALLFAIPASPSHAARQSTFHGDWGRCIAYLPQLIVDGQLNPGQVKEVFTWSTTCHSAFSASARGTSIRVQKLVGTDWETLTTGYSSHIADLGPGTYRIMAVNSLHFRTSFSVRHRRGLG
jgi:hypothetical protein